MGGFVIGMGDFLEFVLGWVIYNGDYMFMYGVNGSIFKILVKYLVNWVVLNGMDNELCIILFDIVDIFISFELIFVDENGNIK